MGEFKNVGNPAAALAEECSEVIKILAKQLRFDGKWDEVPPGETKTRFMMLEDEMADVLYQWERLKYELVSEHLRTKSILDHPEDKY